MKAEDLFQIGYVTKTKGLKGEVQVYFDVDDPENYLIADSVFLEISGKYIPYFIEELRFQKSVAYIIFDELTSIEEAQKVVGKKVFILNKHVPKRSEKDFTLKDLKGFMAIDEEIGELGEVTEVLELPQQFIATVNFKGKEILFPMNDQTLKGIDLKKKSFMVLLPDGLLDIYLE
jgi:16S rRNA processing protein RimM